MRGPNFKWSQIPNPNFMNPKSQFQNSPWSLITPNDYPLGIGARGVVLPNPDFMDSFKKSHFHRVFSKSQFQMSEIPI